jgi:hypothetical protein
VTIDGRPKSSTDLLQRGFPRYGLESASGSPAQGRDNAVRVVLNLVGRQPFRARESVGDRMLAVGPDPRDDAVIDLDSQTAELLTQPAKGDLLFDCHTAVLSVATSAERAVGVAGPLRLHSRHIG